MSYRRFEALYELRFFRFLIGSTTAVSDIYTVRVIAANQQGPGGKV